MSRGAFRWVAGLTVTAFISAVNLPAAETVATAVYSRVAKDYKRERQKDGTFKPEFYGLANGGRIAGTGSDVTVDRINYPEVAEIASRLLAQKNYHYAQSAKQADLMIVLHWGTTIAFNGGNYNNAVNQVATSMAGAEPQGMGNMERDQSAVPSDGAAEGALLMLMM